MAVKVVEKKNNTLGMLGTLASLGGMVTGQPWLGALGTGMQGMNSMMNGDSNIQTGQATAGALNEVLNNLKDIWRNPAKSTTQAAIDKAQEVLGEEELARMWSPYLGTTSWRW